MAILQDNQNVETGSVFKSFRPVCATEIFVGYFEGNWLLLKVIEDWLLLKVIEMNKPVLFLYRSYPFASSKYSFAS